MEFSSDIRANEVDARNKERREQKSLASSILSTRSGQEALLQSMASGGPLGRKITREIKRSQSSGRISGWLADQTINSAIQSTKNTKTNTDENGSIQIGSPINFETIQPFNGLQKFKPEIPSSATASSLNPWDIYIVKTEESSFDVKVRAGTISGILPQNWDDEFTCSKDTLYYGKVIVQTDGRNVTSATIDIDTSEPQAQEANEFSVESPVEFLFGLFRNTGFRIATQGNIPASPSLVLTTTKSPAAQAGESPYVFWYRLQ
jgi:hypothetical protein